jgi:serine/threonine-protein kinase
VSDTPEQLDRLKAALAGRYRIERELGRGGMAVVYLAEDRKLERQVAIKVLKPELAAAIGSERFLREIKLTARLEHPHILTLHDSGDADGLLYYVMPYVAGESLRERLHREKQLPLEDALQIAREVADALHSAHTHDVVHRDIKPENILLEEGHAVVADFGLARAIHAAGVETLTATGIAVGTPAYMSPEQAAGSSEVDQRSDEYALACVVYEMLAGEPPFTGPTAELVLRKQTTAPLPDIQVDRPGLPPPVVAALSRALTKTPADRFTTVAQFAEAITPRGGITPTGTMPVDRIGKRRWMVAGAAVAVAVAVAVLVVRQVVIGAHDPGPPPPDRPYTVLAAVAGSADSLLRETVEYLMRSGLDMAHVVQTVPATEVERLLTLMQRPETKSLDPATGRELAERYGVPTIVLPRLDRVGDGLVLAVRVEDVATGQFRAEASGRARDVDTVVEMVDAVMRELRRDLGETRAVLTNREPLPQVLTSSLDALRQYQEGTAAILAGRPREAIPLLREALALDPAFAEAQRWLGNAYVNLEYYALSEHPDSGVAWYRRALQTPERLRDVRRRDAEAILRWFTDFALWDESMFHTGIRNNEGLRLGFFSYYDSALTLQMSVLRDDVRRARRFDPERRLRAEGVVWGNAISWASRTGRLDELAALRDSLGVETTTVWDVRSSLASGNWDRADSLRLSAPEAWSAGRLATLDAARGRIRESYERLPDGYVTSKSVLEVVYGVPGTDTVRALAGRGYSEVDEYATHGIRAALLGDSTEAKRVSARLRAARDSATSALFERWFEPSQVLLDAGVAIQRGSLRAAAELLEPCARRLPEQGYGAWSHRYFVPWVLADVYAHLGLPDSAIAQLESVVQLPAWFMYSAAHFKLGDLYTQVGDTAQALEHYATFLDAFTDPDPEYEWMVEEARGRWSGWREGGRARRAGRGHSDSSVGASSPGTASPARGTIDARTLMTFSPRAMRSMASSGSWVRSRFARVPRISTRSWYRSGLRPFNKKMVSTLLYSRTIPPGSP